MAAPGRRARRMVASLSAVTPSPASLRTGKPGVSLTNAGLKRRLKRHFLKQRHCYYATCAVGLERFLAREVERLPLAESIRAGSGGVEFEGPIELVYHANLLLRVANRVVLRIGSFVARSYPELYDKCRRIRWELYLGFSPSFDIEVSSTVSRLHHTANLRGTVAEAVVESMGRLGVAAGLDSTGPRIMVRLHDDRCTLSLDSSGELLHKRGYRPAIAKAPLRETIAAALLAASGWERFGVIADPCCGSGTIAIEAALLARGKAPGGQRGFAFEQWPSHNAPLWERVRSAEAAGREPCPVRIVAGDLADGAVRAARGNAQRAGVAEDIEIVKADCRQFNQDGRWGGHGLVIVNLPYGKRVGEGASVAALYSQFGRRLRESCRGWSFGLIVPSQALLRQTGLTPRWSLPFSNGGLRVEFVFGTID